MPERQIYHTWRGVSRLIPPRPRSRTGAPECGCNTKGQQERHAGRNPSTFAVFLPQEVSYAVSSIKVPIRRGGQAGKYSQTYRTEVAMLRAKGA